VLGARPNGVQRMVTTKQYDLLNRLTNSTSVSSVASWFVYAYNSANQRTRTTLADGSYWVYGYDSLGQVTSGRKCWSDGTGVAGQQFEYTFDTIGNRQSTGSGGDHDQYGGALHYASYWANSLNQYTSRDVPGYVNVIGSAKTNATVSLWTADGLINLWNAIPPPPPQSNPVSGYTPSQIDKNAPSCSVF